MITEGFPTGYIQVNDLHVYCRQNLSMCETYRKIAIKMSLSDTIYLFIVQFFRPISIVLS